MRQTFIAMGICCAIGISTLACQDKILRCLCPNVSPA